MGKVAAWRPVRRGKNDRALTRYKSHYGVNLLDPSPPTDFQPPGTVLGCRLWATSHANSDKVPLSPLSLCLCLYLAPSLPLSLSFSLSFSLAGFSVDIPSSSLFVCPPSPSLSLSVSLFPFNFLFFSHALALFLRLSDARSLPLRFYSAGCPHSRHPRGTPTPTGRSQGISVPGTSAC